MVAALAVSCAAAGPTPVGADVGLRRVPLSTVTEAEIALRATDWLVSDGTVVWTKRDTGQISGIDPATNTEASTVVVTPNDQVVERGCNGLGFGDGALWACDGDDLVKVDPATASIVGRVPVEDLGHPGSLPVEAGRVWAIAGTERATLVGVGTASGAVEVTLALGGRCTDAGSGFGAVWVACVSGELLRIDPVSGSLTARIGDLPLAQSVSAGAEHVSVAYERGVAIVDPDSNEVTGRVRTRIELPVDTTADGDALWIRAERPFLRKVDTRTRRVVARVPAATDSGGSVLVAFGSVWATTYDDAFVYRVDPTLGR